MIVDRAEFIRAASRNGEMPGTARPRGIMSRSSCRNVQAAALSCAARGAVVEQVEDDLLVAVLIQIEGDLLGGLVLLAGHTDRDLLAAVAGVT